MRTKGGGEGLTFNPPPPRKGYFSEADIDRKKRVKGLRSIRRSKQRHGVSPPLLQS